MSQKKVSISEDSINRMEAALESKIEQFGTVFEQKLQGIQESTATAAETVGISFEQAVGKTSDGLSALADAVNGSMLGANTAGAQLVNVLNGVNSAISLVNDAQSVATSLALGDYFGAAVSSISLLNDGMTLLSTIMEGQGESWDQSQTRIMNEKASWDELRESQAAIIENDLTQIDHTQDLWKEMQTLVDENGNVKEGYEERVKFIAEELNAAVPDAVQLNDDETVSINLTSDAIDRLLAKKRAQIILAGLEVESKDAMEKKRALEQEQIAKSNELYEDAAFINEMYGKIEKARLIDDDMTVTSLTMTVTGLEEQLEKKATAYDENEAVLDEYYQNTADYERIYAGVMSDNYEVIDELNQNYGNSFKTARTATEEELAQQVRDTDTKYEQMKQRYERHSAGITQDMVDNAKEMKKKAEEEYAKLGEATVDGAVNGTNQNKGKLTSTWNRLLDDVLFKTKNKMGITSPSKVVAKMIGAPMAQGLAVGFEKESRHVFSKMADTVYDETAKFAAFANTNANFKAFSFAGEPAGADPNLIPANGTIKTVLNIDGREFAVATADYMSEELAWRNS